MKIFNNTTIPKKYKNSAIVIGNFDGLHKGHQKIFYQAKQHAKKNSINFGVLTFSPLPIMFFNKNIKNYKLVSNEQKFRLFKKYGVNFIINIKFNKIFSKIKAEKFINNIIFRRISPSLIFVSNNFRFGYRRKGNVKMLQKLSKKYNYRLINTKTFKHKKKIVSSTLIRKSLQNGHLDLANTLLSRTWFIEGVVKRGKKLGKKLGYPTCNINIKNYVLPKIGIYTVKILIGKNKKIFNGIAYLGYRPTFDGKEIVLEVNIFGIKKNLYKKMLRVYFLKFIRGEQKFRNSTSLMRQMNKDVIIAKKSLKTKLVL
jgi:riboflavin kinase/FMN adenylyltransferase